MLPPSSGLKDTLCLLPASCWFLALPYFFTLKMEALCSSEMSLDFQQTAQHYIPEDRTLPNHCSENLKSYKIISIFQINKDGSFLIKDIQHSDEGNYSCTVENVHGSEEIVYSIRVRGMLDCVMVVNTKMMVFWDATICRLIDRY
jgi:hypothetical protein